MTGACPGLGQQGHARVGGNERPPLSQVRGPQPVLREKYVVFVHDMHGHGFGAIEEQGLELLREAARV